MSKEHSISKQATIVNIQVLVALASLVQAGATPAPQQAGVAVHFVADEADAVLAILASDGPALPPPRLTGPPCSRARATARCNAARPP